MMMRITKNTLKEVAEITKTTPRETTKKETTPRETTRKETTPRETTKKETTKKETTRRETTRKEIDLVGRDLLEEFLPSSEATEDEKPRV